MRTWLAGLYPLRRRFAKFSVVGIVLALMGASAAFGAGEPWRRSRPEGGLTCLRFPSWVALTDISC